MKTINETTKEVTHEWHKLSWMTRFSHSGEPPSFDQLAKAGIIAGLRMAAEVCESQMAEPECPERAEYCRDEILTLIPTTAESIEADTYAHLPHWGTWHILDGEITWHSSSNTGGIVFDLNGHCDGTAVSLRDGHYGEYKIVTRDQIIAIIEQHRAKQPVAEEAKAEPVIVGPDQDSRSFEVHDAKAIDPQRLGQMVDAFVGASVDLADAMRELLAEMRKEVPDGK